MSSPKAPRPPLGVVFFIEKIGFSKGKPNLVVALVNENELIEEASRETEQIVKSIREHKKKG